MEETKGKWKWKNLTGFWICGLCCNFAFVVMLSAARDILDEATKSEGNSTADSVSEMNATLHLLLMERSINDTDTEFLQCKEIGTGAILLADILPAFIVRLTFPFVMQYIPYGVKVCMIALFSALSFILASLGYQLWVTLIGVIAASFSIGLGGLTFFSLTTFYHTNAVIGWSSGSGAAGIIGSVAYAGFTSAGLSPRTTLLTMVSIPLCMILAYTCLLSEKERSFQELDVKYDRIDPSSSICPNQANAASTGLTFRQKLLIIPTLFKYTIPLALVYLSHYFINQGLHEILYFNEVSMSREEQYRWFAATFQVASFIGRSFASMLKIKRLWIFPILQIMNMIVLLFQVFYRFIPNIWIVLAIIFWEGLVAGTSFLSTFYALSVNVEPNIKEFCMGAASVGDSFGISIAGVVSMLFHNRVCSMQLKM